MNKTRIALSAILIVLLALSPLVGCSACGERPAESTSFDASAGIDDNGYWKDITAGDYIELFDYENFSIPKDVHEITDEAVQEQIDTVLKSFSSTKVVDGKAAQEGDTINVDYVGKVDGVEYEGGSSGGKGADFVIGTSSFVDDFVEQLAGHTAGEVFDVEVTLPEDYSAEDLQGKEAVFSVTVNSVSESVLPELTDEFVAQHLAADNGWTTVEEMKTAISDDLQKAAVRGYVQDYLAQEVTVSSIPESLLQYQEDAMAAYYTAYAESYGVTVDELLSTYSDASSLEELIENSQEEIRFNTVYSLSVQAIAEDAGITATEEDVADYFLNIAGESDYSSYEEEVGLPYLKQIALGEKVVNLILEHVVYE